MFCTRCGAKNPDDTFFCNRCGSALIQSQPQQIRPQQIRPQQIRPQQIRPQQIAPQQIEPQQPTPPRSAAIGAKIRAVFGYIKRPAHPFLLVFELFFSVVFAFLFTVITFRYFLHGTMSSPLGAVSLVLWVILFFAVIHYGKILMK
jgi:hypothetical protein